MGRTRSTLLGVLLLTVVLGCGKGALQSGTGEPTPVGVSPSWATYAAKVVQVRPGDDDRSLVLGLDVPAGAPDCATNPHVGRVKEERGQLFVNVLVDSARSHIPGACPTQETLTWTMTLSTPVTGKVVMFNNADLWAPDGEAYRDCDDTVGCHPPDDHCSPVWLDQAVSRMDVPRHSFRDTRFCNQGWLIVDVDVNTGQCGADPRPSCSVPPAVTRWFFRFDDGWQELTGSRRAGCADVHRAEPQFPATLCEKLAIPGE